MQIVNLESWQFCLETNGVNIGKWWGASRQTEKDKNTNKFSKKNMKKKKRVQEVSNALCPASESNCFVIIESRWVLPPFWWKLTIYGWMLQRSAISGRDWLSLDGLDILYIAYCIGFKVYSWEK